MWLDGLTAVKRESQNLTSFKDLQAYSELKKMFILILTVLYSVLILQGTSKMQNRSL